MALEVAISKWRLAPAPPGLRIGFVDVLVPAWGVVIHDIRILRCDGEVWCERHGRNVARPGEAPVYRHILSFTHIEGWRQFREAVIDALRIEHPEIFEEAWNV